MYERIFMFHFVKCFGILTWNLFRKNISMGKDIRAFFFSKRDVSQNLIISAFLWYDTDEGNDYWNHIHRNWLTYLRENESLVHDMLRRIDSKNTWN